MDRRYFLKAGALLAALGASGLTGAATQAQGKGVRIVIAGAGAAGLSLAARLARQVDNASITVVDAKKEHHFQPGLTLVGAGIWTPSHITDSNARYMPRSVRWVQEAVVEFDPDGNQVVTASGQRLPYDFLFVATGLKLDYAAIDGMSPDLIGRNGIASIYAGPQAAQASCRRHRSVHRDGRRRLVHASGH